MTRTLNLFNKINLKYIDINTTPALYNSHDLSIPIILAAFLGASVATFKRIKDNTFLDMDTTDQMRAIAILLIILSHYITRLFLPTTHYYWIFKDTGGIGVGIFLALSGYGLMMSYMKKGLEKYYLLKRFMRVLLPYWIFLIPWIILDARLIGIHHSAKQLIEGFAGVVVYGDYSREINPAMWYVMFILIWYIIFFAIFSIKTNIKLRLTFLFIAGGIILLFSHNIVPKTTFAAWLSWGDYAIYFPIGVLIAYFKNQLSNIFNNLNIFQYILLFFILFAFGQYYFFLLAFAFMLPVLYLSHKKYASSFLLFIGSISYELYLAHVPPLLKYDFFAFHKPYFLSFIAFFMTMCILAYSVHILVEKILAPLTHRAFSNVLPGY